MKNNPLYALYLLLVLSVLSPALARDLNTEWDVRNTTARKYQSMELYQAESLAWTNRSVGANGPLDLTGLEVRWEVVGPWSNPTGTYVNTTGTVAVATNGQALISVSAPAMNLPTNTYYGFLRAYSGTNLHTVLAVQKIDLLWSPDSALYATVAAGDYPWTSNTVNLTTLSNYVVTALSGKQDAVPIASDAEVTTGTQTTARLVSPAQLKLAAETHAPAALADMAKSEFVEGTGIVARAASVSTVEGSTGGVMLGSTMTISNLGGSANMQAVSSAAGSYNIIDSPSGQDAYTLIQKDGTNVWLFGMISDGSNGGNRTTNFYIKSISGGTPTTRLMIDYHTGEMTVSGLVAQAVYDAAINPSRYHIGTIASSNLVIDPANGIWQSVILDSTITNATITTPSPAAVLNGIYLDCYLQSGSSRTWNTNTITWNGGSAPTLNSNSWNRLLFDWRELSTNWFGAAQQ